MADALISRAKEAVELHKKAYYKDGDYRGADFWDYAEIFEIICDLYELSGDKTLPAQFDEMYNFVLGKWGMDWEKNIYNDDIMWLCIANARAYMLTGDKKFLDIAVLNFGKTFDRAYSEELGGGLFWRTDKQCKNTCVNCPAAIAAAYLAEATGDESYIKKTFICLDWAVRTMFEPDTGKVYDCIGIDGRINRWSSTYNQGTFMGACMKYYEYTGEEKYLDYAAKAAEYARFGMYSDGIMNNEESGNDLPGFKGIMARYIRHFAVEYSHPDYLMWLRRNADSAWSNRNSDGIMITQLAEKTPEGTAHDVFTASAAVSVVVNSAADI